MMTMTVLHTIRYEARCCFNVRSKADTSQLNLPRGNRQLKSGKTEELKSKKNGYARKYRGIRGVSPGEEKEGCGGKDLQKRKVSSPGWKSEGVMDDESVESTEPMHDAD